MFLVLGRTIKEGWTCFWRNGWLSTASVSVLALSLYVVGALLVLVITANNILENIESKINVSVYLKADVSEEKIEEIKSDLESYAEIKLVEYISRDQALDDFKKNNADEPVIMQSLEEIGENPLLASLIIKANSSDKYEMIAEYVEGASFAEDISRVNYGKNKEIIDKLNNIIAKIENIGLIAAGIFGVVSILIIFNTVRIAIYVHKQEIEVMRLVGASNSFIRLPFIFQGILYGIVACVTAMIILFATIKIIEPYASSIISQNLMEVFWNNIFIILGAQLIVGVLLGVISSWIAMRKYLRI